MLDKGLINVLAEILDQPEEDILKYFTPKKETREAKEEKARPVDNSSSYFYDTISKIEEMIKEIQNTLKEDAHQRHALELQMSAINKRMDILEKKISSEYETKETDETYEYLVGLEIELNSELEELSRRKNITVEDSAKIYRCNIQLDLLTDIINTLYHE